MSTVDNKVVITEVGPRDGIQNHPEKWSVTARVNLINQLLDCNASGMFVDVEFGAFVNPKRVPNMAHSKEVFQQLLTANNAKQLVALVPNMRGLNDALDAGVCHIAIFASASESFSQSNIGMSIEDSMTSYTNVLAKAKHHNCIVRAYISCGWWCPYEGAIDAACVLSMIDMFRNLSCDQIVIADTIGKATPSEVTVLLNKIIQSDLVLDSIGLHFHDSAGQALLNVDAALAAGFRRFDAAIAGLGGCPFAPGAPGNLSTLALVEHLNRNGMTNNLNEEKLRRLHRTVSTNRSIPIA